MADRLSERLKAITRRISDHLFSDEVSTLRDAAAELDRREAIVAAAEAFKRAEEEWVTQTEADHRVTPQLFHKWSEAKEALLALLPAAALKG